MKKLHLPLHLLLVLPVPGAVLFEDTFDRADSDDLSAAIPTGQSGSVVGSGVAYNESADVGPQFSNIGGNQLGLADGPNSSQINLDYNFATGASGTAITTAGGFSVSLDIASNNGTTDDTARWVGFGVGLTASDVAAYGADFGSTAVLPGLRGNESGTVAGSGLADWFIAATRTGAEPDSAFNMTIFQNGIQTFSFSSDDASNPLAVGSTLEVTFALNAFAAGASVVPTITYGGETVGSGSDLSFTFEGDDAGYLGITARQNNQGWAVDNLRVETVPEPGVAVLGALASLALVRRRR